MKSLWKKELEVLVMDIIGNKFALLDIDRLHVFSQKYQGREDYSSIKFSCESFMSTIYSQNDLLENALELDLRLMRENPPTTMGYDALVASAINCAEKLNRINEVMPYIISFLHTTDYRENDRSYALSWYIEWHIKQGLASSSDFEFNIINIMASMGIKKDDFVSFADWIILLSEDLKRANIKINSFFDIYNAASDENRIDLSKEYLETEPLEYYRDRMKYFSVAFRVGKRAN